MAKHGLSESWWLKPAYSHHQTREHIQPMPALDPMYGPAVRRFEHTSIPNR